MIALLGSLFGFISSMVPEIFKILQDKADKQHELTILQMQIESAKVSADIKREEINSYADATESRAIYRTYNTGISWVDALNGTVRPVITYCFFLLYAYVKFTQYHVIGSNAPLAVYLDIMWNPEDQAIFAGVISFYFGQRAMRGIRGK